MHFHIIAMAALGKGLSGSDRIFIELSKNLRQKKHKVTVYVWEEGYKMCVSQKLTGITYRLWKVEKFSKFGFFITYIYRILISIFHSFFVKLENNKDTIIYSASDFWMDSLPGWILKKRFPHIIWIGTFYLKAPNPLLGFKEKGKIVVPSVKDIFYWLMQKLPYLFIRFSADLVCFTSEPDVSEFPKHKSSNRYFIMKGGVDTKKNISGSPTKVYDAVFQGRFHKQKGILELIDIWKKVLIKLPNAKLVVIGDGPLYSKVKEKIQNLGCEKNITLLGYLFDGEKKNNIFRTSKIVVHPAIYDSGGMAAAEAMAFGLPGVSFDLQALKSYYPQGMLKAKTGDLNDFANKIIDLLAKKDMYNKLSNQAIIMIKSEWSWENRTDQFLKKINEISKEK